MLELRTLKIHNIMAGDNHIVTEAFLASNFTVKTGITAGTNNTIGMSCDQILARYLVDISGVSATGNRLPGQNQLSASVIPDEYGYFYNLQAIYSSKNICPAGWHVPTYAEVSTLITNLGGDTVAGGHIKESGTTYWNSPNTGADNSSGFNGKGAGFIRYNGMGTWRKYLASWWINRYYGGTYYWNLVVRDDSATLAAESTETYGGSSLRLIKDDSTNTGTMTGNDGKVYSTVKIGDQVWMAKNSEESLFRTGELIPISYNWPETGSARRLYAS